MYNKKKNIHDYIVDVPPVITGRDIIVGFLVMTFIIILLMFTMWYVEDYKGWIKKDTNVRYHTPKLYEPDLKHENL